MDTMPFGKKHTGSGGDDDDYDDNEMMLMMMNLDLGIFTSGNSG